MSCWQCNALAGLGLLLLLVFLSLLLLPILLWWVQYAILMTIATLPFLPCFESRDHMGESAPPALTRWFSVIWWPLGLYLVLWRSGLPRVRRLMGCRPAEQEEEWGRIVSDSP
jgi:hypothetical protein